VKIIRTAKYANTFEGYDPYTVDFTKERAKAKVTDTDSLFNALSDAIEAIKTPSANEGKYYDQASVYRAELTRRGYSPEEQDKRLEKIPSLHTKPMRDSTPTTDYPELGDATLGAF